MTLARRAKSYRKKSGVYASPVDFSPGGGGTRQSVMEAAEIFAEVARRNAAPFSTRIPAATSAVPLDEQRAMVVTNGDAAPNAAPFEFAERHPLFGDRQYWYTQPMRQYMSRAANNPVAIEAASDVYGDMEAQLLAAEYGYDE